MRTSDRLILIRSRQLPLVHYGIRQWTMSVSRQRAFCRTRRHLPPHPKTTWVRPTTGSRNMGRRIAASRTRPSWTRTSADTWSGAPRRATSRTSFHSTRRYGCGSNRSRSMIWQRCCGRRHGDCLPTKGESTSFSRHISACRWPFTSTHHSRSRLVCASTQIVLG